MGVLPACRLRSEKGPQGASIGRGRVFPVGADGVPTIAESFLIGVTVLGNDRGNPLRVPHCQSKAGRRPVIKHVDCESVESYDFGKSVDDARDAVKGVFELTS